MPSTFQHKRSATTGAVPASLSFGELALNYSDGFLYYKNAAGNIVPLTAKSGSNAKLDSLSFNGSTQTFSLSIGGQAVSPNSASSLLISLGGVLQEPGVSYSVTGSQITFTAAPASGTSFFGVHLTGGGNAVTTTSTDVSIDSPSQLTADQNNYTLPANTDVVRLSSDGVRAITGFAAIPSRVVTLINVGLFDIRIAHESSSSTAASRVTSSTAYDLVLGPNDSLTLLYDTASSRWRTAGVMKSSGSLLGVYDFTTTTAPADATGSNGSWTWTLPTNAKYLDLILIGPGGGGGSGRRGASGTNRGGGGGGGGGGCNVYRAAVANFDSTTAAVVVPGGGAGGATVTANDTNGNSGSAPTAAASILFGTCGFVAFGGSGSAGGGGTTTGGTAGGGATSSSNNATQFQGAGGGAGGSTASPPAGTTPAEGGAPTAGGLRGGGGGGGINSSNVAGSGGNGGYPQYLPGGYSTVSSGTGGAATGAAGVSGLVGSGILGAGVGGGGGGGNASGSGGNGGSGGIGAGGGGGGASLNGFNSGAGGNGGPGYVRVVAWS